MANVFVAHVYIFIMTVYHTFKVGKGTVTNFDTVTTEQFMKLMCFWEMFMQ